MQIHSGPHNTPSFKNGLWWKVIVCSLITLGLGSLSGLLFMDDFQTWYEQLNKPIFTPPNWLFGPAWSILYVLMGGSLAIIWQITVVSRYPIIKKFAKRGIVIFIL